MCNELIPHRGLPIIIFAEGGMFGLCPSETHLNRPHRQSSLAEGEFGEAGGKTAHGVVMHSDLFTPTAVVDSKSAGETPGRSSTGRTRPTFRLSRP